MQVSGGVSAVNKRLPGTHTDVAAGPVAERRPAQQPRCHLPRARSMTAQPSGCLYVRNQGIVNGTLTYERVIETVCD